MAHADETDDSHAPSRSHPGCAMVPAALAIRREFGIDGTGLLRAVTLGYDIGTRVAMAMGGADFSYEVAIASTHSIAGIFGAAAAAACAAGLDARQMRWLLDYTAQQSSGIVAWQRDTDHIEKAFVFAGMPARNGVTAALLVESGWNGVDEFSPAPTISSRPMRPKARSRAADRQARRALRDRADRDQEMDGRLADSGSARRASRRFAGKKPFERRPGRAGHRPRSRPSVATVVDNRDIPDICLQHMVAVMLLDKTVSFQCGA